MPLEPGSYATCRSEPRSGLTCVDLSPGGWQTQLAFASLGRGGPWASASFVNSNNDAVHDLLLGS